jgi:hypothetical protein
MKSKFRFIFIALAIASGSAHADIIGAGIGGLIGSQFGQGNGKIAMAALGAVIGDRVSEGVSTPTRIATYDDEGYPEVRQRPAPRAYVIPADEPQIVRVTPVAPARIYQPYYGSVGTYAQPGIVISTYPSYGHRQHPGLHRGHYGMPRGHHH